MKDIIKLHQDIITRKIPLHMLGELKDSTFHPMYNMIVSGQISDESTIASFIKLCLDYYTYSEDGDTLITDTEYDHIMNVYIGITNQKIIYADTISDYTTWPFIQHIAPGMVGTISKIYSEAELQKYLDNLSDIDYLVLAPKYDGISACINKENGYIEYAVTRADGSKGQNILPVVREAKNAYEFSSSDMRDGFYKVELVVGQSDYDKLITEKKYANRRSATSGIINSPKNLQYAHHVTILPLAYYNGKNKLEYIAPGQRTIHYTRRASEVLKEIEKILSVIRRSDFPYRTDGVVIFPKSSNLLINHNDIMEEAVAYKVNTAEALTIVEYGYMSVGRLGNAVPMLKVKPVEVNETIVADVSLGSYDKFATMDIHEKETVVVYSAGDVIPQVRIPEKRDYDIKAPYIKIEKVCPYCNMRLERIGNEYKCTNQRCVRIITGKITNFLVKIGAKNISDKTIEDLYNARLIYSIQNIFQLKVSEIANLPGYSEVSATNIISELDRLSKKEITVSSLFGAIGIPNISEKKCRNIFKYITIGNILSDSKRKIEDRILNADNVGIKTAEDFSDFVSDNRELIKSLMDIMNVRADKAYLGNVVFTGFRNDEIKDRLEFLGYELSDSVNSRTIAVVSSGNNESSTKCKNARKKGISIVNLADIDDLLYELRKRNRYQ